MNRKNWIVLGLVVLVAFGIWFWTTYSENIENPNLQLSDPLALEGPEGCFLKCKDKRLFCKNSAIARKFGCQNSAHIEKEDCLNNCGSMYNPFSLPCRLGCFRIYNEGMKVCDKLYENAVKICNIRFMDCLDDCRKLEIEELEEGASERFREMTL